MSDETPDQVTLDDLQVLDFFDPFPLLDNWEPPKAELFIVCTRCSSLVVAETEYREGHERWHAAVESAGVSAPTQTEQPAGEYQPLREQLIQQIRDTNFAPAADHWVDLVMPVIEAWCEKYLHRATNAETLLERWSALQLDCDPTPVPEATMPTIRQWLHEIVNGPSEDRLYRIQRLFDAAERAHTCDMKHAGLSRGETDRLRRVEDALVAAGAPNRSELGDPGGLQVAWIRRQQDLVEELRKQVESLSNTSQNQRNGLRDALNVGPETIWSRMIMLVREHREFYENGHQEPPFGLREQLLEALQVEDTGQDIVDLVRKQLIELAAHREHECTWTTGQVNARVDERRAGIIALLDLAGRGRDWYGSGRGLEKDRLAVEAETFRNAANLVRDPSRIYSFIPTSMIMEVGKLADNNELPADPQRNAEVLTDQMLTDMLCLVGVTPTPAQLATWTPEQREQAAQWAGAVHLDASDNDVDVPERPAFLDEQPEPESRRETGWRCDACSHPNTDDAETCEACDATRVHCPALRLDHAGVLHACVIREDHHVHKGETQPDGMVEVWTSNAGVPVPWPLDQEPPAGIDILQDTSDGQYLCREGSWWVWRDSLSDSGSSGDPVYWTGQVEQVTGELHVVRP